MKSTYPSCHSFFDSTSDSIREEDIDKCRGSVYISSLADLFTNPSCRSDLFPNVRVSVPEEVCFPAKKKRECEEKTSIWHEWGSGECQTENVAQESSGFSSDLIESSDIKSSALSPSYFPNLGSANISLVTEGFTFPARKKREEESSWREERTPWQDWISSGASKEIKVKEISPVVGSISDMYMSQPGTKAFDLIAGSKSGSFSSLGAPARSSSEEVCFPARKKREERSFWQESILDGFQSDCEQVISAPRNSTPGVGSIADMFKQACSSSKCSTLFSDRTADSKEEVVFPKRKHNADRNAWRDWSNTGHCDCEDYMDEDYYGVDNVSRSTSEVAADAEGTRSPDCEVTNRIPERSETKNSPVLQQGSSLSVHEVDSGVADSIYSSGRVRKAVSGLRNDAVGNVDRSDGHDGGRCSQPTASHVGRAADGWESLDAVDGITADLDVQEPRFSNSKNELGTTAMAPKYPPPLRSLSRQGSLPSHMPWVHFQPIRSEGRFVLQEVKVTQPVVFQPIRKEGRLVLQLIGQENSGPRFEDGRTYAVPGEKDLKDSVTLKTGEKVKVERNEARQPRHDAALVETLGRLDVPAVGNPQREKTSSTVLVAIGAPKEKERKRSPNTLPTFSPARELLPAGKVLFALTEEPAAGMWDRPLNLREVCYKAEDIILTPDRRIPEREKPVVQDRPPPWLLGKVVPEERKFIKKALQSASRNAGERLGQKGNIITIQRAVETASLRVHLHTVPRTSSLRNGLSGLNCPRGDGDVSLARGRSIRSLSFPDVAAFESAKEEARGRAVDVCQGIIRDSVMSIASAHSFLRSLRPRPDHIVPGEPDPRYDFIPTVTAAFSCADGMGKRHHEKKFWEQQPCVS